MVGMTNGSICSPSHFYVVMPKLLRALESMEIQEYIGWAKLTEQLTLSSYGEFSFHESKEFIV